MITGACYAMWLYNRVVFGQLQVTFLKKFSDINEQEFYILTILFIFLLITGIYPNPILDTYSLYAISVSN